MFHSTAEELLNFSDDNQRHELVRGHLVSRPLRGCQESWLITRLAMRIHACVEAGNLGALTGSGVGFHVEHDPDTVLAPAISFVRRNRIAITGIPVGYYPGPPDLAVEFFSPSDPIANVDDRVRRWLDHGSSEVWSLAPSWRTVTVYRSARDVRILAAEQTLESPELLPGFRCPVAEIFNLPQ